MPWCTARKHFLPRGSGIQRVLGARSALIIVFGFSVPSLLLTPLTCPKRHLVLSCRWMGSGIPLWMAPHDVSSHSLIRPEPASYLASELSSGRGAHSLFPNSSRPAQRFHEFHHVTVSRACAGLCAICVCAYVCGCVCVCAYHCARLVESPIIFPHSVLQDVKPQF